MPDPAVLAQTAIDTTVLEPTPTIGSLSDEAAVVAAYRLGKYWLERHYDHLKDKTVNESIEDV